MLGRAKMGVAKEYVTIKVAKLSKALKDEMKQVICMR